ncbi:EthD domain-containing protein [Agrobacterium sp. MCAB5]|uniref:EthD domain-containing protein n=1 Tax=Agrobacterium sp. MCAB5 TaxID=3233042 RepID=UPI003F8F14D8
MLKRMTLLAKREDLGIETFRTHWAGNHAQLALSLPGVCKYDQNRVDEELLSIPPTGAFSAQGIVELYFTDDGAMKLAQASETGAVKIPEDELLFLKGWSLNLVETEGPHDGDGTKVMIPLVFQDGVDVHSASDALRLAGRESGATEVSLNHVTASHARPRLWSEPVSPDIIVVLWFGTTGQARDAFAPGSTINAAIAKFASLASVYLCDTLKLK